MNKKNKKNKKQLISIDEKMDNLAEIIFSNMKLYVDQQFQKLAFSLQEIYDLKLNVATLSSILNSKNIFDESEYKNFFSQIINSFGVVSEDGIMDGNVEIILYNFEN